MKSHRKFCKIRMDTVKCNTCGSHITIARPQAPTLLEQNRELKEAIKKIHKMSKYNENHDESLYSLKDIHDFSKTLLNKYPEL